MTHATINNSEDSAEILEYPLRRHIKNPVKHQR